MGAGVSYRLNQRFTLFGDATRSDAAERSLDTRQTTGVRAGVTLIF